MNANEQGIILIVDDMPNNLGVLLDCLNESGFEVLVAKDGESAIEQAKYALPDLILLDVLMPGIDGFETCSRLKSNQTTKDIPVIFMTALSDAEDKVKGLSVGGVDYVTKPIQQTEVLARVTTHLSIRNLQQQLQQQNSRLQQEIVERIKVEKEIKQLNENLKRRTIELVAVNKELEAFSYSVSHDLRAYVRRLMGFSQVLRNQYENKLDPLGKNYLQQVQAASGQMNQLIDGLLHLSYVTRSEISFETVNLSNMARQIAAALRQSNPERAVDFVIEDGIIVRGDRRLLKIMLDNLLGNAWKYTGKNLVSRIEFGVANSNKQLHNTDNGLYFIRDNGVGFDMVDAEKLFGTFVRLHSDKEYEGTGIGLATVQRIIQRHGGQIWAEAAVNQGATFYFTL